MIILVPEKEENIANSNERRSPRSKRMTDHIAFLIDCARKGCIFLLEKELHKANKYQVVHLEERVRGGESLFSGHHNPEDPDNPILLGFLLHPVSASHGVGWGVGEWCGGERQVWWVPWDSLSPWSRVIAHRGLFFCARTYAPVPPPLASFQDWVLFCVEVATLSWA